MTYSLLRTGTLFVALSLPTAAVLAYSHAVPSVPVLIDSDFQPIIRRAAYASFLADACSISNKIQSSITEFIRFGAKGAEQQNLLKDFRGLKASHSADAGFIGIKKRCYFEREKTNAIIADVQAEISSYVELARKKSEEYKSKRKSWEQSVIEHYAPYYAKEIVRAKYDGGSNIGANIISYEFPDIENSKSGYISITAKLYWQGTFTGKDYSADGVIRFPVGIEPPFGDLEDVEVDINTIWNPTSLSPSLKEYITCFKKFFGKCNN